MPWGTAILEAIRDKLPDLSGGKMPVVAKRQPTVFQATGSAALALSTAMGTKAFRLVAVTVHFSAAPTTSESLTVKLNAKGGAAYDTLLYQTNPSVGSITDLCWTPDGDLLFEAGDEIDLAFTNTDGRTYGARIVVEEV